MFDPSQPIPEQPTQAVQATIAEMIYDAYPPGSVIRPAWIIRMADSMPPHPTNHRPTPADRAEARARLAALAAQFIPCPIQSEILAVLSLPDPTY